MKYRVLLLDKIGSCGWLVLLGCLAASPPARGQEKSDQQRRDDAVQRDLKRLIEDERREQRKRDYQTVLSRAERAILQKLAPIHP